MSSSAVLRLCLPQWSPRVTDSLGTWVKWLFSVLSICRMGSHVISGTLTSSNKSSLLWALESRVWIYDVCVCMHFDHFTAVDSHEGLIIIIAAIYDHLLCSNLFVWRLNELLHQPYEVMALNIYAEPLEVLPWRSFARKDLWHDLVLDWPLPLISPWIKYQSLRAMDLSSRNCWRTSPHNDFK